MTLKEILLTKLNSILNTPLEKKVINALLVLGTSLISVRIFKFLNFKLTSDYGTIELNNGGNYDSLLIIGLSLIFLATVLLIYFRNKEVKVKKNNPIIKNKKISQELLLKYTTIDERGEYLSSYEDKTDLLEELLPYINSIDLSISIEIQFKKKNITIFSSNKTNIKIFFPANEIYTVDFDKLIMGQIDLIKFINTLHKTHLAVKDFDKLVFSWEKYLRRYSFNWTNIIPREVPEAEKLLNENSVLWIYGNTCTGKTYLGIQLYKKLDNQIVFNSAYNGSISIELITLLLNYGYNYSLLLDDLQTDYENSSKLIKLIHKNKQKYIDNNVKIILISWIDLYNTLSHKYNIDSISIDPIQFVFYLKNKIPVKYRDTILEITQANIALLDATRKLLKKRSVDKDNLENEIFKYFCPITDTNDLFQIYISSILGTFDFEIEIDFLKLTTNNHNIFDYKKMPTVKLDEKNIFLGHRTIANFIYQYLKKTTDFDTKISREEVIIRYLEYIDINELWSALIQIIGTSSATNIGEYTPLWKLMINFQEAIIQQNKYDSSWKNTPSSMYFSIKTLSLLGLEEEYQDTLNTLIKNFTISNNSLLINYDNLQTQYDFIRIKEKMEEEDIIFENNHIEKGIDIDPELMHKNWLLGLLVGLHKELKQSGNLNLHQIVLSNLLNTQKNNGAWYPARVPWVTSRILIGLGQSSLNKDNITVQKSIDYLLSLLENGYCESHTGGWNNIYETTSLCLEALTDIGFNCKENKITNNALNFLLNNKDKWMNKENELDGTATACLLIKIFGINKDLFNYIEELSSRNLTCLIGDDLNFDEEQSCKSAQIGYYIVDLSWFIIKQDLSGLLEAFLERSQE